MIVVLADVFVVVIVFDVFVVVVIVFVVVRVVVVIVLSSSSWSVSSGRSLIVDAVLASRLGRLESRFARPPKTAKWAPGQPEAKMVNF